MCCLDDFSSVGRRAEVDDVEGLSKAEILIRDELDGRGSRGICGAFEKTKGRSLVGSGSVRSYHAVRGLCRSATGVTLEQGV